MNRLSNGAKAVNMTTAGSNSVSNLTNKSNSILKNGKPRRQLQTATSSDLAMFNSGDLSKQNTLTDPKKSPPMFANVSEDSSDDESRKTGMFNRVSNRVSAARQSKRLSKKMQSPSGFVKTTVKDRLSITDIKESPLENLSSHATPRASFAKTKGGKTSQRSSDSDE